MRSEDLTQPLNSVEAFSSMAETGEQKLGQLRQVALAPDSRKSLSPMGAVEAARWVGVSRETIRNMEDRGQIEAVIENDSAGRPRRKYTWAQINRAREIHGTRPTRPEGAPPIVINVGNLKGGAGKTTTAVHSAQYFARLGYRVLLIDMDPQASATAYMGLIPDLEIEDHQTIGPALTSDPGLINQAVRSTYWDGLDLIPSQLALVGYEMSLMSQSTSARLQALRRAISSLPDTYDIILIDTPPAFGMLSLNGMCAGHHLLVPVQPALLDVASCLNYWDILQQTAARYPEAIRLASVSLLLTQVKTSREHRDMGTLLRQSYGVTVMNHELVETQEVAKCSLELRTIYEMRTPVGSRDTWARANAAFDNVFDELHGHIDLFWSAHADLARRSA